VVNQVGLSKAPEFTLQTGVNSAVAGSVIKGLLLDRYFKIGRIRGFFDMGRSSTVSWAK